MHAAEALFPASQAPVGKSTLAPGSASFAQAKKTGAGTLATERVRSEAVQFYKRPHRSSPALGSNPHPVTNQVTSGNNVPIYVSVICENMNCKCQTAAILRTN